MRRAVVLVAGPLLIAACAGNSKSEKVIPWIPDRPRPVKLAPRSLAPPCRASQLHASLSLQGATGSLVGGVTLRHIGGRPCALLGLPGVRFVGGSARTTRWVVHRMRPLPFDAGTVHLPPSSLRGLRSGEEAFVLLSWSNWCGKGSTPTGLGIPSAALVLSLPRGGGEFRLVSDAGQVAPRCDVPEQPSSVGITVFKPAEHQPAASSHLPLRATVVGRELPKTQKARFRVDQGKPFHYRVALTNVSRNPFHFENCPAYVESLVRSERYVLNCRPVGTLEPGERALFGMVLHVPADAALGNGGISWELGQKTASPPFTVAGVIVTR